MIPGAFFLLLFLGSSFGMSTSFIPAVEVTGITSTEMTTEMTSVDKDQGSGKRFHARMIFVIQIIQHLVFL